MYTQNYSFREIISHYHENLEIFQTILFLGGVGFACATKAVTANNCQICSRAQNYIKSTMKPKILVIGLAAASCFWPMEAIAADFTGLYVFGDSLSDTGNFFKASSTLLGTGFPPPPYVDGRFSNGDIWIDYLADDLNLQPTPIANVLLDNITPTEGVVFAFGGATSGTANTIPVPSSLGALPGLQQQIGAFASRPADPDALYIIWAGANDYLPNQSPTFQPFTSPAVPVANLSQAINTLYSAGARNFLVPNLPDLGTLPLVLNTPLSEPLDALSQDHNALLSTTLDGLSATLPNSKIVKLDIGTLFQQAVVGDRGFTNVTTSCFNRTTGQVCTTPNTFLFWDLTHPTTAAHKQIADLAYSELHPQEPPQESVPEPSTMLGLLAIGGVWLGTRHHKRNRDL